MEQRGQGIKAAMAPLRLCPTPLRPVQGCIPHPPQTRARLHSPPPQTRARLQHCIRHTPAYTMLGMHVFRACLLCFPGAMAQGHSQSATMAAPASLRHQHRLHCCTPPPCTACAPPAAPRRSSHAEIHVRLPAPGARCPLTPPPRQLHGDVKALLYWQRQLRPPPFPPSSSFCCCCGRHRPQ